MREAFQQLVDRGQYVTVDGVETHYYDEGEGEAVVLLHGGGLTSCAELNWGAVIDPLSEHFRVIALDQPGFGFTDPRGERDHLPRERAEFVAEFCAELGVESATIVGNSRAGYQTVYLALAHPDLVAAQVVVNAGSASRRLAATEIPGSLRSEEPTHDGARAFLDEFAENHLVAPENHPLFAGGITAETVDRVFEMQRRNWEWTNARNDRVQTSANALNRALSYEGRHITEAAAEVKQPTLITWSTRPYEGWPRREDVPEDDTEKRLVTIQSETVAAHERDEGFDMGVRLFERIPTADSTSGTTPITTS